MTLLFRKMNGAGNDFVLIDNRTRTIQFSKAQIIQLCHRQRGIGADGVMLLIPCTSGKADWAWQFYNSDGSTAEMCGNGARCFARFVQKITGSTETTTFETEAGVIKATYQGERVSINLTAPKDLQLHSQILLSQEVHTIHSLNTGVPHAVMFVADADAAMVQLLGAEIRYHTHFAPRGTYVNFVQLRGGNSIRVRTYERGVEGETLACGTGVTASALIASRLHQLTSPVQVQVQGGDLLEVRFEEKDGNFSNVSLSGPADFTFEGSIEI
jgi:diaminopimelate epimerase